MTHFKNYLLILLSSYIMAIYPQALHPCVTTIVKVNHWFTTLSLTLSHKYHIWPDIGVCISFLILPMTAGVIPALIFYISKRRFFPYAAHVIWVVWLIQVIAVASTKNLTA